ncbi:hypothetical protein ACFE04_025091 [Oxalis oulophora]
MGSRKYSCENATQTHKWIKGIVEFIKPYDFLINSHVVNFFQDRLWESVDKQWMDCLRNEPIHNLLLIPSAFFQDHWPASLKEFIITLRSLVFPRQQADLQTVLPGLDITSLNSVLAQGMNFKKKHEVEVLSAVVSSIANNVKAGAIVDVGAGQGYLAQVLSFHYNHSVIAIDGNHHHGRVTEARADRIKKHYMAQMRKSRSGIEALKVPKTITCRVMSTDTLNSLASMSIKDFGSLKQIEGVNEPEKRNVISSCKDKIPLVLAGLHACGDLSVTMLKTFSASEDVKAVVSLGCCYNLLSENGSSDTDCEDCGFPMSCGIRRTGISLGKSARDLACQSAERWKGLPEEAGLQNFELHAFRAAFQMGLCKYYPQVVASSPSIGRQGKTLRRRQQQRTIVSQLHHCIGEHSSLPQEESSVEQSCSSIKPAELKTGVFRDVDRHLRFEKFSYSGLSRLGLEPLEHVNFRQIWEDTEPYTDLIGPYWSLRAAFGPLLETLILLDRLMFLQEQGKPIQAVMLPIFDPALSPRNVAIIAKKS